MLQSQVIIPIFKVKSVCIISFTLFAIRNFALPSHIKPQLGTFEKAAYGLCLVRVVVAIKDDLNWTRNILLCQLCHKEIPKTKMNYKNEIRKK